MFQTPISRVFYLKLRSSKTVKLKYFVFASDDYLANFSFASSGDLTKMICPCRLLSKIFSHNNIQADCQVCRFIIASLSHNPAIFSQVLASLSHNSAIFSQTPANISHDSTIFSQTPANLFYTPAIFSHAIANFSHTIANLFYTLVIVSHAIAKVSYTHAKVSRNIFFRLKAFPKIGGGFAKNQS